MNRREMILGLASAALIPSTGLLANGNPDRHDHHGCDRKFAEMITALEHRSWDLNTVPRNPNRLKIAEALFTEDFFEILGTGTLVFRVDTLATSQKAVSFSSARYSILNGCAGCENRLTARSSQSWLTATEGTREMALLA
jgi:hypothetical protein